MPSQNRLAILLSTDIGPASRFRKTPQRLVRVKNASLQDGDLLLQLSLKELGQIRRISKEMNAPRPALYEDSKTIYDDLKEELERLEIASQSTSWLNFLKRLELRRETHDLVERGQKLYITTTSESMQRHMLSCITQVEAVTENDIRPDEAVKGFSFVEDEEPSDGETVSTTSDPFDDPGLDTPDGQIALQNVYNLFVGCVNADNSDAHVTMHNGGDCAA